MDTNILLDEFSTYFLLDFLQTKAAFTIKGEESRKFATRPPYILEISGKLSLLINLSRSAQW